MSNGRKGFTLIELMTVMGILAILFALFMPVLKSVRGAAYEWSAGESFQQLGQAVGMYATDFDDTLPPAMYETAVGLQAWFGLQQPDGTFDPRHSLLAEYLKGRAGHDATFIGQPYMGDGSGFGYNWGYLGSDMHITGVYRNFPNCVNPAKVTEIAQPSQTIEFATSSYYFAKWLTGGDGVTYDFGFIDPPKFWYGNPNVDFRHQGEKKIDTAGKKVTSTGLALTLMVDGHVKPMHMDAMTDAMFERGQAPPR